MHNSKKYQSDTKWFQAFYKTKIPISIVCHPTFMKATNNANFIQRPPNYHAMRKNLLVNAQFDHKKVSGIKDKIGYPQMWIYVRMDG